MRAGQTAAAPPARAIKRNNIVLLSLSRCELRWRWRYRLIRATVRELLAAEATTTIIVDRSVA